MTNEIYFMLWGLVIIIIEVYMKIKVVDDDGISGSNDDDAKQMSKDYADLANTKLASYRRFVRVCYIFLPALIYFLLKIKSVF